MPTRIYVIDGGWYGGVSYECNLYDPETEKATLVFGGSGTRKKDIIRWLKKKHSSNVWNLKTKYTGDQWIYTFTRK